MTVGTFVQLLVNFCLEDYTIIHFMFVLEAATGTELSDQIVEWALVLYMIFFFLNNYQNRLNVLVMMYKALNNLNPEYLSCLQRDHQEMFYTKNC